MKPLLLLFGNCNTVTVTFVTLRTDVIDMDLFL